MNRRMDWFEEHNAPELIKKIKVFNTSDRQEKPITCMVLF